MNASKPLIASSLASLIAMSLSMASSSAFAAAGALLGVAGGGQRIARRHRQGPRDQAGQAAGDQGFGSIHRISPWRLKH